MSSDGGSIDESESAGRLRQTPSPAACPAEQTTERLFANDDEGLVNAATWRGQLEFVCDCWLEDGLLVTPELGS